MSNFHQQMEIEFGALSEKDSLKRLRGKAWEKYLQLGIPTKKNEHYRYIKIPAIVEQSYSPSPAGLAIDIEPYIFPECKESVFVFVNGRYSQELSRTQKVPNSFIGIPLSEATTTYSAFLTNQWNQSLTHELDPFVSLNGALHQEGFFFFVPAKHTIDVPIQILHLVNTGSLPIILQPRFHFFAGKNAQCSLIFHTVTTESSRYGINQVTEISLDEGARLHMTQNTCGGEGWHLDAVRATLKRSSSLQSVCLTTGSQTTRHDYRIALTGENGEADLKGIAYLQGKRESHFHILMDHQAPHCRSNQTFKTVLKEMSRGSFEGKIYVHQAAQKTEAYQRNSNLIDGDLAIAYSKPNLEIFADDVKASHGSTVGQIDLEQLFYLKARGFSDTQAKRILIEGFCHEIVDHVPLPSVRQSFQEML